jgi:hypothetical protein
MTSGRTRRTSSPREKQPRTGSTVHSPSTKRTGGFNEFDITGQFGGSPGHERRRSERSGRAKPWLFRAGVGAL